MEAKRNVKTGSQKSNAAGGNSLSYTLFLYREELRRRNARVLRLSRTKITLTDVLISKNVRHLHECSVEDLRAINREMMFRKQLKQQISRLRKLQQLGLWQPSTMLQLNFGNATGTYV